MLRIIIYVIVFYFLGKMLWDFIKEYIPMEIDERPEVKGENKSESDIEIDNNNVEDVDYREVDDDEER